MSCPLRCVCTVGKTAALAAQNYRECGGYYSMVWDMFGFLLPFHSTCLRMSLTRNEIISSFVLERCS